MIFLAGNVLGVHDLAKRIQITKRKKQLFNAEVKEDILRIDSTMH